MGRRVEKRKSGGLAGGFKRKIEEESEGCTWRIVEKGGFMGKTEVVEEEASRGRARTIDQE